MNRITAGDARLLEQVSALSSRGLEISYFITRVGGKFHGAGGNVIIRPEPESPLVRRWAETIAEAHMMTEGLHRCLRRN